MIDPKDTPAKPSAEALFMADEREMIATLMAGTGAMREAGKTYLPQAPAESPAAYKYRKNVSTLYNGLRRTVKVMAGKPFSEPMDFGDTMPPKILEWCDDIDLQGQNLHAFAHSVFACALADGLSHILVDYPQGAAGVTLADQAAAGKRPYFVHVRQDQILGWRSERITGVETLTQLRLMEAVTVPSGAWGTAVIDQVRVLERDNWSTYRKNNKGEWLLHEEGAVTLGAIPLATVYCERVGYMQASPPLLDLAWLNIEHWQSASDQSNILHVARVPILFASGFGDGKLVIGGMATTSPDPTSDLRYVEHSGKAIESGRQSLKDLEERMSLMGAQLLVRKPGSRTATEKAIDSADADCELAIMARNLEDTLQQALQFMADWEKIGPVGEVELTGEIGGLEDMELTALLRAQELGLLSKETVFAEMQRRGLISDDIEWTEEAKRLKVESDAAQAAAMAVAALKFAPKLPTEVPGGP